MEIRSSCVIFYFKGALVMWLRGATPRYTLKRGALVM